MTQCDRLLKRLQEGPVTPMQAWNELGIYRLAPRVLDLRARGHDIARQLVAVDNRFGETCHVAQYHLVGQEAATA